MSKKRINPDRIESVKASYRDMSTVLSEIIDFIGTDDASNEKLAATTAKVKAISQQITSAVESMDAYLNSVAAAFRQTDARLSSEIDGGFQIYRMSDNERRVAHKQRELVKQQNPYYSKLP